jgi:hypothetical protein
MVMTTKERTDLRKELVSQGYAWEYVDEWQPKTTLFLHRPKTDPDGKVVVEAGKKIEGVPGNPDYVARKARIGMLPYPPGPACECRWCIGDRAGVTSVTGPEEQEDVEQESVACQECGEQVTALTKAGALSRMRVHVKTHRGEA